MAIKLTQVAINSFLKSDKKKISDEMVSGLQLQKMSKKVVWRFRYKFGNKDTTIKIGDYPDISLKTAREVARSYKELLARGIEPLEYKRQREEEIRREQNKKTFEKIAFEFLELVKGKVSEKRYKSNYLRAFNYYILPQIGYKKIDEIKRDDIIKVVKNVKKINLPNATNKGNKTYTAKEVYSYLKKSLDYALNLGLIEYNVAYGIDLDLILEKHKKVNMKAVVDKDKIRDIFKKILDFEKENELGSKLMQFQALTALRNSGLYRMKWEYIDWDKKLVVYPPNTYKGNKDKYILPLTDTLIEIIKFFKMIYYKSDYVFRESNVREETLSNRLKDYYIKLGIKEHTRHGWRSAFKTILTEMKVGSFESIEKQLGHRIGNEVNMSYFRSDMIDERREILKFWEDFLYNRVN